MIKVCESGKKTDWFWYERYYAAEGNTVRPVGQYRYCEYPAVLVHVVLGNPKVFPEAKCLRGYSTTSQIDQRSFFQLNSSHDYRGSE